MKLLEFDDISNILNLNASDKDINELCFNAAYSSFEKYVGFNLSEKNYNELQTVIDCKVFVNETNITEMVNIIDMNTKEKIKNCIIDSKNRTVFFLSYNHEKHVVFLNYNAGYTKATFPEELKEAIIKLFLIKKNNFMNKLNNLETETSLSIPDDIKQVFDVYKRKSL